MRGATQPVQVARRRARLYFCDQHRRVLEINIEHAPNHPASAVLVQGAQCVQRARVQGFAELGRRRHTGSRGAVVCRRARCQVPLNLEIELCLSERLDDVAVHTRFDAPFPVAGHGMRRERDDGQPRVAGREALAARLQIADRARGAEAIHLRHLAVHQHERITPAAQRLDRGASVRRDLAAVAQNLQHLLAHCQVYFVVLDQKDARFVPCTARLHRRILRKRQAGPAFEQRVERGQQFFPAHRLGEPAPNSELAQRRRAYVLPDRAQHQQFGARERCVLANAARKLQSVHLRHMHIEHRNAVRVTLGHRLQHRQRLRPARRAVGADPFRAHLLAQDIAIGGVVIDDQHMQAAQAAPRRLRPGLAYGNALERQDEPERRTLPQAALHVDFPTHQLDQLPADRKTQPGAAVAPGGAGIALPECLEDAFPLARFDADPGVAHLEAQHRLALAAATRGDSQHHFAPVGKLDRVAQQIAQHLPQPVGVAAQPAGQARLQVADQFQPLGERRFGEQIERVLDDALQVKGNAVDFELSGLDPGKIENVVDDREQRRAGLAHRLGEPPLALGELGLQQ